MTKLPPDFKDFLKLLNEHKVDYLLIGGYAVGYYGYVRATADIDFWVRRDPDTANKLVAVLKDFGFAVDKLSPQLFLKEDNIVRLGEPPFRIELMTGITGRSFVDCFDRGSTATIDGVQIKLIGLEDLKQNKLASGRHKDLDDLEHLP